MNLPLPKRLSGRRTLAGPERAASEQASPDQANPVQVSKAERDAEYAAYLNWVAATVGEHGWAVSGRHGDRAAPSWAYSVGMWVSCQVPELVLCGLPVENGAAIINAIGARVADGAEYCAGDLLDDICPAPLTLRPVEQSWRTTNGLLGISNAFYGMVRPPYLQVVWSDRNGRFPWDQGFQPELERLQPLLWLHRDDNPPSPWTRLDRLS